MWIKLLLAGLGLLIGGLVVFVLVERTRFKRENEQVVAAVLAASTPLSNRVVRADEFADLPTPVQRYFSHVLRGGQPYVETVRMEQSGTFRDADAASAWSPFTAVQHVTTQPPGFVWNASIEMIPGIPVRVLDAYHDGRGRLRGRLGGIVAVADPPPGPELDEGALLRYLAEAPLYPTALLPAMGVTWTPVDDRSARATLTDRGTTASLLFHFNEKNEVVRVTGRRPFLNGDGTYELRPWMGDWRRYAVRDGMCVPTEGEVAWVRPGTGKVNYWRGHMEDIEYEPAEDVWEREASPSTSESSLAQTTFPGYRCESRTCLKHVS